MLSNKNIVRFIDDFEDSKQSTLLFELCEYGTLGDYLSLRGHLYEQEAQYFFK